MKSISFALLATAAFSFPAVAQAQSATPLFASEQPIHVTINAPINTVMRNRALGTTISGTLIDPAGQALPVSL